MSRRQAKKGLPEQVPAFAAYYAASKNSDTEWNSLYLVLRDGFTADVNVQYCLIYAQEGEDTEGERLANILLTISPCQRRHLGKLAEKYAEQHL